MRKEPLPTHFSCTYFWPEGPIYVNQLLYYMNKTAELHVYMHTPCCKPLIYKDFSSQERSLDHLTCTTPSLNVVFCQQCTGDWLDLAVCVKFESTMQVSGLTEGLFGLRGRHVHLRMG